MHIKEHNTLSPNDVRDIEARSLAASCIAGIIPETEARWHIAALLQGSGVVEQVVSTMSLAQGFVDDVTAAMWDIARIAIVGIGSSPKLDLNQLADGASLCGWMRQFLSSKQARISARRSVLTRSRLEKLTDFTDGIESQFHRGQGSDLLDADVANMAIAVLAEHSKGLRSFGRAHLVARVLSAVYHLPQLARAIDMPCRATLLAGVENDLYLVHRALRSIVEPTPHAQSEVVQIAALFDGWTKAQVDYLLELSPVVAHALVVAALTPVPPPQATQVSRLRDQVAALGTTARTARALATTFSTLVAETTCSEFDARSNIGLKSPRSRAADRQRWEQLVDKIVAQGWTRLGTTPGEVEAHLSEMLDRICYGELELAA